MHKMKKCKKCDAEFVTESQLRIHFGLSHKDKVLMELKPTAIKPVVNIWSGETVTWDPFVIPKRKVKSGSICMNCKRPAFIIDNGRPICYGYWATWGCYYSKQMIDDDRKWYRQPCRNRNNYIAKPLSNKEKSKLIKQVALMERSCWISMFWTPLEELEKWHDDKLRIEYRMLERVESSQC